MTPILKAPLAALALAAAPLSALAQDAVPPPLPRVVEVVGEGRANAPPDMARISLGVSQQAKTAGEAMGAMSFGMAAVLGTLGEEGVAQVDIQTGQLMLEPSYDYNTPDGNPVMTGFIATQILEVNVRDIGRLGEVLDAVVEDGANRVNGIVFDVSDPKSVSDAARRAAVQDARARAELYADAAGLTLGAIVSISETTVYSPPIPMYDARGAAQETMAVPVAPGEVSLMTSVTVTYAIDG